MVPTPNDLIEVSLEVLSTEVVIDADQSALNLEHHCFGNIHMSAGLRGS
ncbi:hypothetical protein FHS66_001306 [Pacificitalea manganoxidans]|nr:hypothetical protein [Pacificitalea manganoxidans]